MATRTGRLLSLLIPLLAGCGARTVLVLDSDPPSPVGGGGAAGTVAAGSGGASGKAGAPGGAGGSLAGQGGTGGQAGTGGAGQGGQGGGWGGSGGAAQVKACSGLSVGGPQMVVNDLPSKQYALFCDAVALDDRALVAWRYFDNSAGKHRYSARPVSASGEALGPAQPLFAQETGPSNSDPLWLASGFGRIGALMAGSPTSVSTLLRLDATGAVLASTPLKTSTQGTGALRASPDGFDLLGTTLAWDGYDSQIPSKLISVDDGGQMASVPFTTDKNLVSRLSLPDGSFVLVLSNVPPPSATPGFKSQLWLQRFAATGSPIGSLALLAEQPSFAIAKTSDGDRLAAAALSGDGLQVAWLFFSEASQNTSVVTRAFSLDGVPKGPVRTLGVLSLESLPGLDVVSVGDGAIVTWVGPQISHPENDTLSQEVFAQLVASSGEPVAGPLTLGTWWAARRPRLVATSKGALVVLEGHHELFDNRRIDAVPLTCLP
jgi:hypothetical protein